MDSEEFFYSKEDSHPAFLRQKDLTLLFRDLKLKVTLEEESLHMEVICRRLRGALSYLEYLSSGVSGESSPLYQSAIESMKSGFTGGILPPKFAAGPSEGVYTHGPFDDLNEALLLNTSCKVGDFIFLLPEGKKLFVLDEDLEWDKCND